jgi:hypothetical protein
MVIGPRTAQLELSITKSVRLSFRDFCPSFRSGAFLAVSGPMSLATAPAKFVGGFLAPMAARLGKGSPIEGFDVASGPVPILAARGAHSLSRSQGNWAPSFSAPARGNLGFEFGPKGGEHVGWVAISVVNSDNSFAAHITGYAYDTVAGQSIKAGQTSPVSEPTTLSLLALGAAALFALRKRKLPVVSNQPSANH